MNLTYLIAAVFIFFGGIAILHMERRNKPLMLLAFFIIASMTRPVTGSLPAWAIELLFILFITRFKIVLSKNNIWYLLFIIFALLSLLYSSDPLRGLHGIVMYVFPLFFYTLAAKAIRETDDVERLFSVIIKGNGLLLISCIITLFVLFAFSYYGMAICTIPLYLLFKTKKKSYIIHFLICLLPALITVKRTPLLGIAISSAVFLSVRYRWKAFLPSVLAIGLGFALVISIPAFRSKLFFENDTLRIQDAYSSNVVENINTNGRLQFWAYAWNEFYLESPVFGAGTGSVKSFMQSEDNPFIKDFQLMHNDWLLMICETGLVGVLLLLLFFITILRQCIRYSSSNYPRDLRLMSAACAGSVAGTMTHMFFENCMNSFVFSTTFVFYAIFNFYVSHYAHDTGIQKD